MTSINSVILMGNLTRDLDVRQLPSGTTAATMGLAISDHYKDKEGKIVQRAHFVDVVVWGRQAETCGQYLKKGSPVLIEGKLQLDQWETESGEKRSKLKVRANRVQFMPRRKDGDTGEPKPTSQDAEPEAALMDDDVNF